jgi:hypothetical protein
MIRFFWLFITIKNLDLNLTPDPLPNVSGYKYTGTVDLF